MTDVAVAEATPEPGVENGGEDAPKTQDLEEIIDSIDLYVDGLGVTEGRWKAPKLIINLKKTRRKKEEEEVEAAGAPGAISRPRRPKSRKNLDGFVDPDKIMGGEEYAAGDSETGEEGVMSPSSGDEREGGEGAEKVPKEKKKRGPKPVQKPGEPKVRRVKEPKYDDAFITQVACEYQKLKHDNNREHITGDKNPAQIIGDRFNISEWAVYRAYMKAVKGGLVPKDIPDPEKTKRYRPSAGRGGKRRKNHQDDYELNMPPLNQMLDPGLLGMGMGGGFNLLGGQLPGLNWGGLNVEGGLPGMPTLFAGAGNLNLNLDFKSMGFPGAGGINMPPMPSMASLPQGLPALGGAGLPNLGGALGPSTTGDEPGALPGLAGLPADLTLAFGNPTVMPPIGALGAPVPPPPMPSLPGLDGVGAEGTPNP